MKYKTLKSSAPVSSILNPAFKYRKAANTDVAATFARIRAEQAAEKKAMKSVPVLSLHRKVAK